MKLKLANKVYKWLGTEWCGNIAPPSAHETLWFGPIDRESGDPRYVASVLNDGFDIYLGYPTSWQFHVRTEDARRLAWWILWNVWICGTWFGIRRKLWYWALSTRCDWENKIVRELRSEAERLLGDSDGR